MPITDRIPGVLVVELASEVSRFISTHISESLQAPAHTRFGHSLLDAALQSLPMTVKSITRLFGYVEDHEGVQSQLLDSMRAVYVVEFHGSIDLDMARAILQGTPGINHVGTVGAVETTLKTNDPFFIGADFKNQWGLHKVRAPEAWDRQTGNNAVQIAVVDTGCDYHHPDLAPRLTGGRDFCENPSFLPGWVREGDFTSPDWDPQDELGHGTAMAGIIAAATNNALGMAGLTWSGIIHPVRVASAR